MVHSRNRACTHNVRPGQDRRQDRPGTQPRSIENVAESAFDKAPGGPSDIAADFSPAGVLMRKGRADRSS
jgi:hypothetical protein